MLAYRRLRAINRVTPVPESPEQAIERYLRSGDHDAKFLAWPGEGYMARARQGEAALRQALISAVRQRASHAPHPEALADLDVVALTRGKVAPMVRGLFPSNEQETVLDVLGRSLVFLTPASIDTVLMQMPWLSTAWELANLYLARIFHHESEVLAKDMPRGC